MPSSKGVFSEWAFIRDQNGSLFYTQPSADLESSQVKGS